MISFEEDDCKFIVREKYYFPGKTKLIILAALQTLGLEPSYLYDLLGLPSTTKKDYFEETKLSADEWVAICNSLYLPLDIISFGYNRRLHIFQIMTALDEGYFHLKKNNRIRSVIKEIDIIKKKNWQFQNNCYGFRLRWKVRWQDFKKCLYLKIKPNPRAIDPAAYAREIAQERKPKRQSQPPLYRRHKLKLGQKIFVQSHGDLCLEKSM